MKETSSKPVTRPWATQRERVMLANRAVRNTRSLHSVRCRIAIITTLPRVVYSSFETLRRGRRCDDPSGNERPSLTPGRPFIGANPFGAYVITAPSVRTGHGGALLTRQDILTNLQRQLRSGRTGHGPREEIYEQSKKRSGPEEWSPDPCSFRRHGRRSIAPDAR